LKAQKKIEETPSEKEWSKTLNSYGYFHTDNVDECLSRFVETGYVDRLDFTEHLGKKNEHYKVQKRDESYREAWHPYSNSFDDNGKEFIEGLLRAFRANIEVLSPKDLQSVVNILREFERDSDADGLIKEYFARRYSPSDIESFKKLDQSVFFDDLKDEHLIAELRRTLEPTQDDKRTLAEVTRAVAQISLNHGWDIRDIRHMNSFSVDDYYNFFKTEKSEVLYWCVRKCLDFGELNGDNGTYKSVGEKAKLALLRIAAESKINRMRVSTLYKIDIPTN
jgi:hypothetical protein